MTDAAPDPAVPPPAPVQPGLQPEFSSFGWDRRWTARAAASAAFFAAFLTWMAWSIGFDSFGSFGSSHRILFALVFALFAALLASAAVTYAVASFDRSPVLVLDRDGVLDRRLTKRPVPWAEIDSVIPLQHGINLMLMLHVAHPARPPMPLNPLWIVNRLSARLTGAPELSINTTSLQTNLPALLTAMQAAGLAAALAEEAGVQPSLG